MTDPPPPRLVVKTRRVGAIEDILAYTDPRHPLAWLRRGEGIVGVGVATALEAGSGQARSGRHGRAGALAEEWRRIAAAAEIDDPVGVPGTGLVAFGALAFAAESASASTLVVPEVIVGRRGATSWVTTVHRSDAGPHLIPPEPEPAPAPWGPSWSATLGPGALDAPAYQEAVRKALAAIGLGEVAKVVLARDLAGTVPGTADLRRLVRALSSGYPDVWTYAVDGIIGASPETLVTVSGGTVTARVLAGTAARGVDADDDTRASLALATSPKDQDEHQYAVRSVLAALRPHTGALAAAEAPFTLKLPNLWHLATDVLGELSGDASALDLVGALHPTAAVAGSPTAPALAVIARLEPFDRGRYAGPVGWVDAAGDGEWAIALRCAQFGEPDAGAAGTIPVTAHAGAGIVSGSDPEAELLETRVKFRPIVDALA